MKTLKYPPLCLLTLLVLGAYATQSLAGPKPLPAIAIIIDDLGYRLKGDQRALALPGTVAYAILPRAPHTKRIAELATQQGKEVLLHQPMQAKHNRYAEPGIVTMKMEEAEFIKTLHFNMRLIPNYIGVSNHTGSLLTQYTKPMQWVMNLLKSNGKFYVDSRTSRYSVAAEVAKQNGVPTLVRDVFLDNERNAEYIHAQFGELVRTAKLRGSALGIAHPHAITLETLEPLLNNVSSYGVRLVNLEQLLQIRGMKMMKTTQALH